MTPLRTGLTLSLALWVLLGAAPNIVFAQEETPPALETPVSNPALPTDVTLEPDKAIIQGLMDKGFFNNFPDNRFYPERPISRAEFVTMLYRASDINTPFLSEFPYYRDVPTSHWAYLPIEGFRIRRILTETPDGFFNPDAPISRKEAAILMSRSIEPDWLRLSPEEIASTLKAYPLGNNGIAPSEAYDVARSIYAGFILPQDTVATEGTAPQPSQLDLALGKSLNRMDGARMIYRRAFLSGEDRMSKASSSGHWVPPGVSLKLSPTSAISRDQVVVGQSLYFNLIESVPLKAFNLDIPRGTRVYGTITEIKNNKNTLSVTLDKAGMPSGESLLLKGQMILSFPQTGEENAFIVPGENFSIITLPAF